MAARRAAVPAQRKRGAGAAVRALALGLLLAAGAACCPAPLAATGGTATAFVAVVTEVDATSWLAEGPGGRRYRVAGAPPGPVGARVYLSGAFAPDGSLAVERADPLRAR